MKAMHVRVVAVMVLLWVACGRAVAYQDDDMDVSALTRRDPIVEDARSWSGSGTNSNWIWPGAGTNGNLVAGKVDFPTVLAGGTRSIPEPSAIMLVGVGMLALVLLGRRRR
jgi:hypothetical protein